MKTIKINAKKRTSLGKKATKALRKENNVPCVIYGQKQENVHFYVHENKFKKLVYTPNSYLIDLDIDGEKHIAKMQSIDFHPVTDKIIHIDFYKIDMKKKFKMEVPIKTEGFAKGIQSGGVLSVSRRKVLVNALAEDLPDELVIDVTNLGIGDAIKISDLKKQFTNLDFLDAQSNVVSVNVTRLAKSMEEGEIEGEGEEIEGEEIAEEKAE